MSSQNPTSAFWPILTYFDLFWPILTWPSLIYFDLFWHLGFVNWGTCIPWKFTASQHSPRLGTIGDRASHSYCPGQWKATAKCRWSAYPTTNKYKTLSKTLWNTTRDFLKIRQHVYFKACDLQPTAGHCQMSDTVSDSISKAQAMTQLLRLHSTTKGCGLHGEKAPFQIRAARGNLLVEAGRTDDLCCISHESRKRPGKVLSGSFRDTHPYRRNQTLRCEMMRI